MKRKIFVIIIGIILILSVCGLDNDDINIEKIYAQRPTPTNIPSIIATPTSVTENINSYSIMYLPIIFK
jgi:protein involved in sex pheromone biosynthesis